MTHTPAPWTLETVRTSVGVCHKIGPLGNSTSIKNACLYDDCYSHVDRDEQLLADAHLIEAAPDMYEACKLALGAFENNNAIDWSVIERAIAKAEGKAL